LSSPYQCLANEGFQFPGILFSFETRECAVFVAASTRCFADKSFSDACDQIAGLEYDKIEIWLNDDSQHLTVAEATSDPERFHADYREMTRLTPVAFHLEHDITPDQFDGLAQLAKLMRAMQVTLPASPLGTPFNTEIDRLRTLVSKASLHGIRISLKTQTGRLTEDPHTAVQLCQAVKGLGLTLDPSYYICGPHAQESHDQVFPYVFHTHLRDTTPDDIQVQVGLGEVDYYRIISKLEHEKYNRALSVDLIPEKMDDEQRPLEMRKIRLLLETHL